MRCRDRHGSALPCPGIVISYPIMNGRQDVYQLIVRTCGFFVRAVRAFMRNRGLLLSGAVAYYTLLSIVPLSIIALVVLTNFIEEQQLILTLSRYFEMLIPGYAATLSEQVQGFLEHRKVIGGVGFLGMLFFSSMAFSMLEDAMSVIFLQRIKEHHRSFLLSAIIPYLYIFALGLGILLVSFIVASIETLESRHLTLFGWYINLGGTTGAALYILGIVGEVLMLASIYLVMPVVRVRLSHALIGGLTAAVLWEVTRRVLVWYYSTVSMVNVIYGSIALTIVSLLSIEVVAIILLFGAQVIAELGRKPDAAVDEERSGFEY